MNTTNIFKQTNMIFWQKKQKCKMIKSKMHENISIDVGKNMFKQGKRLQECILFHETHQDLTKKCMNMLKTYYDEHSKYDMNM